MHNTEKFSFPLLICSCGGDRYEIIEINLQIVIITENKMEMYYETVTSLSHDWTDREKAWSLK